MNVFRKSKMWAAALALMLGRWFSGRLRRFQRCRQDDRGARYCNGGWFDGAVATFENPVRKNSRKNTLRSR